MDTLGSLVDKLITVDMKMWYAQEDLYEIRHMTFEEFKDKYKNDENLKVLWKAFQKSIDLNLQRNGLIDEIDERIIQLTGVSDDGKNLQRKHKTY